LASNAIASVEGELRVLAKVSLRDDLTDAERAAIATTTALRRASVAIDRGKQSLLQGDFSAASESFQFANSYYRSPKIKLVLFFLRLAPQLLRHAYRFRASNG
jgi:hypothetical protein